MRPQRTSKIRTLPVSWPVGDCAWASPVNVRPSDAVAPEAYFIGLLGLGAAMPPIILTPKNSQKYELKQP